MTVLTRVPYHRGLALESELVGSWMGWMQVHLTMSEGNFMGTLWLYGLAAARGAYELTIGETAFA